MNKKLIAVAVASALGVPTAALAQSSNVQIYGLLNLSYAYIDQGGVATGAPAGTAGKLKTDMMYSNESTIGFKGEESLGGGLAAWIQCENTLDPGSGSQGNNVFCAKNSAFGLKGSFGNVYFGTWDTPAKVTMANFRPLGGGTVLGMGGLMWGGTANGVTNPVTTQVATIQQPGGTVASVTTQAGGTNAGTSFFRRANNSINYVSPNYSGFELGLQYSAANEATAQTSATQAAKPRLYAAGLTYTNGPLILGATYETHRNYNPGNQIVATATTAGYTGGKDREYNLGAAYTILGGTLKLMGMYASTKYELNGGDLEIKSYSLHGDWAFSGPHRIRAGYTWQSDTKGSFGAGGTRGSAASVAGVTVGTWTANAGQGDTAATLAVIQYAYNFSKRTELSFGYAKLGNSTNAVQALQSTVGTNKGQDQSAFNLQVKHAF